MLTYRLQFRDGSLWVTQGSYGSDKKCWDKWGRMIGGTHLTFEFRDIGIVLLVKKLVPGKHKKAYIKILTSRGIGWIFENSLEVVK